MDPALTDEAHPSGPRIPKREVTFRASSRWAEAGPLLSRARLHFARSALLATSVLLLAEMLATSRNGRTLFGPGLGADDTGFDTAVSILVTYPPDRTYDLELQDGSSIARSPRCRPTSRCPSRLRRS